MKTIILAGGVGTRLWPLSREYFPKQFIPMDGRSLFQKTCERAKKLSGDDGIWVVTNAIHRYLVRNQIDELGYAVPEGHILAEPVQKNTLPAIAWAMQQIRAEEKDATAVVFPSDHLLGDDAAERISEAESLGNDCLVTFGIKPTSPHTGYGYIRPGKELPPGFAVEEFKEKPDAKTAAAYVKKGYLWNSGIFLLSVPVFFAELKKYQPRLAAAFAGNATPEFGGLDAISIDYGLLEPSKKVAVVPLDMEWSDLGTFATLYAVKTHDGEGNAGEAEYLAARHNYVDAPGGKRVGLIGVDNLVVVDTADALLVCDNRYTEQVKDLVGRLKKQGDPVTQFHRQVHRPWGSYTVLENTPGFKIKRVTVKPGQKLSLQLHHHRSEHWVVVSGTAEVELNGEIKLLRQGESTFVTSGIQHRLKNPGVIPLEVIEVQLGQYLEEDDIVRFEDDYGRT
ncbi:mannose-1-phosphate guanylyltransferase/mannose-6-phosphate isomerase [Methanoregula sp.]|uniref:mannose-1-phosphate guanylyltransferase/mannose-6-phosphate isomerase n=1 Tax=Methanoregula sp. TaxID=2052170 RepID=UPI002D128CC1|nr:mannose-1-phosphate guanylyltransferase/mannose-6-phosphate isomerase [Methanoregula sp.]HVP95674.1 mannose-1-phosphate guanylyltransferase/mannose-6-phosphate isomerase [Methanoregula sp.]